VRSAVLVLFLAVSALAGDAPAQRAERGPDFGRRVHEAIRRGIAWLRTQQSADGSFRGPGSGRPGGWGSKNWSWNWGWGWGGWGSTENYGNAVSVYVTLRTCGVPSDDPSAKGAWDALHRAARDRDETERRARYRIGTGVVAMTLLAIESHGDCAESAEDRSEVHLSPADAAWAAELVALLAAGQHEDGGWSRGIDEKEEGRPDFLRTPDLHSCTHFALLGLDAAARCGIAVDPAVWRRALDHLVSVQELGGPTVRREVSRDPASARTPKPAPLDRARGWGWGHGSSDATKVRVWTTACGVASVAICRRRLAGRTEMTKKLDTDSERSMWDGLAWLGRNWPIDVPADLLPRDRWITLLYGSHALKIDGEGGLWAYWDIARAGMAADVDRMADLDWYGYGAEPLLAAQSKAGCWGVVSGEPSEHDVGNLVADTCKALLFLAAQGRRGPHGAVTPGSDVNIAEATKLTRPDFDAFVRAVLERLRRAEDLDEFERLLDRATSVGPRIVEPLLRRLDAADAGDRATAHDVLVHATGRDFSFDPDGDAASRDEALVKWEGWWLSVKDRLAYDAATKRLVVK